jgi:alkylated DNA repair dioxygenase AlkB
VIYTPDFFSNHEEMFNRLWTELAWLDVAGPRLEYYVNDHGVPYTYGSKEYARSYESQPDHPIIAEIRNKLQEHVGVRFDVCFLNGYRNGKDQLGWHSDDSPEMDDNRPIAIVTLGAKREIYFKMTPDERCADCMGKVGAIHHPVHCNRGENAVIEKDHTVRFSFNDSVEKLWLESGSLCLMAPGMQDTHQHRIPKASYECGPRISLTFRGYVEVPA